MTEDDLLAYVRATATLLDLPLERAAAQRVALHLGRTAELARLLEDFALAPGDEPAEVFCPAPFPRGETA